MGLFLSFFPPLLLTFRCNQTDKLPLFMSFLSLPLSRSYGLIHLIFINFNLSIIFRKFITNVPVFLLLYATKCTTFESNKSSIKWPEKIRLYAIVKCTCSHCTDLPISHNLHDIDCLAKPHSISFHFIVCWLSKTFSQPKIKTDINNKLDRMKKLQPRILTIGGICINQN